MQTVQDVQTRTSQNQREDIFYLPHPPPPTPGTDPLQTISQPRARRAELVPVVARGEGGGNRSN